MFSPKADQLPAAHLPQLVKIRHIARAEVISAHTPFGFSWDSCSAEAFSTPAPINLVHNEHQGLRSRWLIDREKIISEFAPATQIDQKNFSFAVPHTLPKDGF